MIVAILTSPIQLLSWQGSPLGLAIDVLLAGSVVVFLARGIKVFTAKYADKGDYRQMFDDSPIVKIIIAQENEQVIRANTKAQTMFELSQNKLKQKKLADLLPNSYISGIGRLVNAQAGITDMPNQWSLTHGNGTVWHALATLQPIQFKGQSAYRILLDDITQLVEQKKEKERLAHELDKKNKYFDSIVNSQANIAIIRTDLEGKYTFMNDGFAQKFGCAPADFLGKSIDGTVLAEDIPACEQAVMECLAKPGTGVNVTLRKPNLKTGEVRTSLWEFMAIVDESGQPTEIQCMGSDITDKIQLVSELQLYKERIDSILNSVNDIIYSVAADFSTLEYINPLTAKILGYEPDAFYANPSLLFDLLHDDDKALMADKTASLFAQGQNRCEIRMIHKNGSIVFISSYGKLKTDEKGKPISITGVITDITEKTIAEQKMREATGRITTILESLSDGFFAIDKQNVITYINRKYELLFNCDRLKLLGLPMVSALPWANSQEFADVYARVSTEGGSANFEAYAEIVERWFNISVYANEDGLAIYLTDITDRKKGEHLILEQNQQLRHIAWVQSHKVRAPLARILGLVRIFNYEQADAPENKDYLQLVLDQANALDEVITEVVHLSHEVRTAPQNPSGEYFG
jgi:PAS domain S-box-containing protein